MDSSSLIRYQQAPGLAIFALWHQCSISRIHRVKLVSWIESSEMMYLVVSRDLVLMALQFGYSPQRH